MSHLNRAVHAVLVATECEPVRGAGDERTARCARQLVAASKSETAWLTDLQAGGSAGRHKLKRQVHQSCMWIPSQARLCRVCMVRDKKQTGDAP